MSMTLSLLSDLSMNYAGDFHQLLNSIHPSLKFTGEDGGDKLAFLDTDISHRGPPLLRSIYRKKTITGLHIIYDSYSPRHHKLATIKSVSIKNLADMYTITTSKYSRKNWTIYEQYSQPTDFPSAYQQMYTTSDGSKKYSDGRRQARIVFTIHWPKEFGIWTHNKETSSSSIPNGGDYSIVHNTVRVSENCKRKLTDDNEKFSTILLYMCL